MKMYHAGNFPQMKDPEEEKAMMRRVLGKYPHYRRLLSFYFESDITNVINIKKIKEKD